MARAARIALDVTLSTCRAVQSTFEAAWPYIKVECVPPMTTATFNGPFGDKLASMASGATKKLMNTIQTAIENIDAAEERQKQAAKAEIIAAQEKIKAEELKKKQEAQKKALEAKKAAEAKTAEKKAEEEKAPEEKKKDDGKAPKNEEIEAAKNVPKKK